MLKIVILGFLTYGPQTGYDLKQAIDHSTKYFWDAKQSQIYRTLKQLEENGLVISRIEPQVDRPDRRVYTITDDGIAEFNTWMAAPIVESHYLKDPLLVKLFFSAYSKKEEILTQLRLQRNLAHQEYARLTGEIKENLAENRAMLPPSALVDNTFLLWENVRQFGEMYYAMMDTWLVQTIQSVEANFNNETNGENE
jgi:DNA-binding PadR family transcriptional regulator